MFIITDLGRNPTRVNTPCITRRARFKELYSDVAPTPKQDLCPVLGIGKRWVEGGKITRVERKTIIKYTSFYIYIMHYHGYTCMCRIRQMSAAQNIMVLCKRAIISKSNRTDCLFSAVYTS